MPEPRRDFKADDYRRATAAPIVEPSMCQWCRGVDGHRVDCIGVALTGGPHRLMHRSNWARQCVACHTAWPCPQAGQAATADLPPRLPEARLVIHTDAARITGILLGVNLDRHTWPGLVARWRARLAR